MLRSDKKWNHIKYSIKTREGRKGEEKQTKGKFSKQKTMTNMVDINPSILIITLNMNGLNTPMKRQRLSEWIKKNKTQLYVAYKKPILM